MTGTVTPGVEDPLARHRSYQAMVGRLLDLVHRTGPPGANVVVVSKGDPALVSLVGRQGWHFPQDDGGGYAGYHPRDDAAAIEGLEALRARGGDFLVLPATARWWLDHYAGFAAHVRLHYEVLADRPDTGTVYRHRSAHGGTDAAVTGSAEADVERHRAELLAQQVTELAAPLPPAAGAVVLVDVPDDAPLHLPGRRTMWLHLDDPAAGPASPAAGSSAVRRLEELRSDGASCLIVTRRAFEPWRTDEGLRPHVERQHRCITRQAHVCLIYELVPAEESTAP